MSKILIVTIFCLLFSVIGDAQQSKSNFYITGKIKVDQDVVDHTRIQVLRDGALLNTVEVNNTGNFRVGIDLNHIYRFVVVKDGFYSKTIEVDSHIPKEVCSQNCTFPPYQLSLLLYKMVPGVKENSGQVGRISYNPKVDNFDADLLRDSSDKKEEVEKAILEIKSQSQKYEKQSSEVKKDKYRKAIVEADQLFLEKNYEKSMLKYRDAVMIFPDIQYPRNRVSQLYQLITAKQLEETVGSTADDNFLRYLNYGDQKYTEREFSVAKVAYEKALQIRPNDANVKSKLFKANSELMNLSDLSTSEVDHRKAAYNSRIVKYNELIAKGDEKFKTAEFAVAKDFYAQAATQIDENSYSLLMIQKIDLLLGSDEAALKLATEREEAEKLRLREARNKAYNDAIAEADRIFEQRLYRDAIEYYELALTIKSFELYPQQQIREIKDILADLQLQGEEYNRLLREGETLFYAKKYSDARVAYVKAHDLISKEKFALIKINEIDELLAKLNQEGQFQEQYDLLIQKADLLVVQKKYTEAITTYQQSLKLKPSENYPKERINEIREIMSRESDGQKRSMQLQIDFDKMIAMADEAFNRKNYMNARSLYQEALEIVSGQEYPLSQIRKIDQLLKEKADETKEKSKLDQIDFSKLDDIPDDLRKAAYDEAMQLGNSFVSTEEWGLARFYFRRALALYSNDESAKQKLTLVDAKIRGGDVDEAKFNEMISKAEEAFKTGDFGVAKFYYNKAREIHPDNPTVNERIQVVNKLAESTVSRNTNEDFNLAMKKANEAMTTKNYSVARFFYRKALSLKPNDEQAKSKLAQVETLINQ